ncbi:hypothetical protein FA95DRAFT_1471840, partial [Auriscalpium vulgare]
RQPMDQLPRKYDTKYNKSAPLLHFGFIVPYRRMAEYAFEEDILPPDFKPKNYFSAARHVSDHLRKLSGCPHLYLAEPWCEHRPEVVVALYSNRNMRKRQYIEEHEKLVVDVIQEELDLKDHAKWYWDVEPY